MLSSQFVKFDIAVQRSVRTILPLSRQFSTTRQFYNKNKGTTTSDFNPRHLGVASDIYIPPSLMSLPNPVFHPGIFFNVLIRKIYTLGLNTIQIALFRNQSGIKPNFVLWKNNAIECYVNVNTQFARNKLEKCKYNVSIWVQEALEAREKEISRNFKLDWKLLKFNKIPKLVSLQSMMIPGKPLEHIQLVYKFDTKQRLISINKKTNETKTLDRDVVDHFVFLCDASTGEVMLAGSVFESKPNAKLPKNYEDDNQIAIARMKKCGDIFRPQPSN